MYTRGSLHSKKMIFIRVIYLFVKKRMNQDKKPSTFMNIMSMPDMRIFVLSFMCDESIASLTVVYPCYGYCSKLYKTKAGKVVQNSWWRSYDMFCIKGLKNYNLYWEYPAEDLILQELIEPQEAYYYLLRAKLKWESVLIVLLRCIEEIEYGKNTWLKFFELMFGVPKSEIRKILESEHTLRNCKNKECVERERKRVLREFSHESRFDNEATYNEWDEDY